MQIEKNSKEWNRVIQAWNKQYPKDFLLVKSMIYIPCLKQYYIYGEGHNIEFNHDRFIEKD